MKTMTMILILSHHHHDDEIDDDDDDDDDDISGRINQDKNRFLLVSFNIF